ncbi:MAG TPA: hypothetical protein VN633_04990 [Bryobacteraceae bacterium]|nr:hypothetical protein [Bryobacteraceae bacterium]
MPENAPTQASIEYTSRLNLAQQAVSAEQKRHVRTGNLRLVVFIAAAAVAYFSFGRHVISALWLVALFIAFVALAFIDDAILRKQRLAARRAAYYERGLARINETWQKSGKSGSQFATADHIYSADLDLFSPGGLFQLLSVARTGPGGSMLAQWLTTATTVPQIEARHRAITELRTLLDFREHMATIGDHPITEKEAGPLWQWGDAPAVLVGSAQRIIAALLSIVMAATMFWWAFTEFLWLGKAISRPPLAAPVTLLLVAAITATYGVWWRKKVAESVEAFETVRPGLALLSDLLLVAERVSFASEELRSLQQKLIGAVKPSAQIRRLNFFADMLDSRENLLIRIFGPPLLWTTHVTFAIEKWRRRYGRIARAWIETISEIEALNSLATYSYEHPDDSFPEITEGGTEFRGVNLGHPLLPGCVRNSVSLDSQHALLIVSGSNMSGKSTFLRTIGINTVLALAGAPVRAQSLRLSTLSLATSLHIADSLQQGASHFSAEISRIRQIVEIARERPPALFLIDEILQGTNSDDRRIGAEAILNRLVHMDAIGVITTHDLALTNIAGANAHFRDQIRDGRMSFDYILKPGVVEGSNALELMRLYGLI